MLWVFNTYSPHTPQSLCDFVLVFCWKHLLVFYATLGGNSHIDTVQLRLSLRGVSTDNHWDDCIDTSPFLFLYHCWQKTHGVLLSYCRDHNLENSLWSDSDANYEKKNFLPSACWYFLEVHYSRVSIEGLKGSTTALEQLWTDTCLWFGTQSSPSIHLWLSAGFFLPACSAQVCRSDTQPAVTY